MFVGAHVKRWSNELKKIINSTADKKLTTNGLEFPTDGLGRFTKSARLEELTSQH